MNLSIFSKHPTIFIIGGGGKTTLLFALARFFKGAGVVTTTSTKILVPSPEVSSNVIIQDHLPTLLYDLSSILPGHLTVGKTLLDRGRKLGGFSSGELDQIALLEKVDYLLVEADGSAGRPLKAHKDYEPVISPLASLVVVVIGIDCLGKPLNNQWVHRAEIFSSRLNKKMNTPLTVEDVVDMFFHPLGYLKEVSPETSVIVFISKVKSSHCWKQSEQLALALKKADTKQQITAILPGHLSGP